MKQTALFSVAFVLGIGFFCASVGAQAPIQRFDCGMAVVSCFSGLPSVPPFTVNVNGPVMGIIDVRTHAAAPPGQWWQQASSTLKYMHPSWTAANMGQIFGLAIDSTGDIYATPTTVYYCPTTGQPSPFGPAGAGGIYRISGATGLVSTYVNTGGFVAGGNSIPNKGSGLGNICYDADHDQLFVTNFADGMIYRIKNGVVLSRFDPFSSVNSPQPLNAAFVALGERTWGIGYYKGRVYFSRWVEDKGRPSAGANEIWSIGLNSSGDFAGLSFNAGTWEDGEVLEITLPCYQANWSNPVSDIAFAYDGRMLLAERTMLDDCGGALSGPVIGSYAHLSRVLEYHKPGLVWTLTPGHGVSLCPTTNASQLKFRVGGYFIETNSAGGVDYGYDSFFPPNPPGQCDEWVWATGDQLLPQISTGQWVYGMQGMPATGGSYPTGVLIDFDHDVTSHDKVQIGDVEIRKCPPCGSTPDFPCEDLEVSKKPAFFPPGTPQDTCCWDITLQVNTGPVIYLEAQILTPGVVFGNPSVSSNFIWASPPTPTLLTIGNNPGGPIPLGTHPNALRFCLKNITSASQVPQMVVFNWYVLGPTDAPTLVCKDTCYFDCKPPVDPPGGCLAVVWDSLVCNPQAPSEFTYYFQVKNLSNFTAQQAILSNLPPGFGFKPCPPPTVSTASPSIVLPPFSPAIPPGGISPVMCVQLVSTSAITSPTTLCFNTGIFSKDSCCHQKHCITLKPCCSPCDRRRVVAHQQQPKDSCCHKLDIFNGCNFPYFTKLELVSLTPGVVFGSHSTGGPFPSPWINPVSTPTLVQWQHLSGFVPFGFFPELIQFCLDSIDAPAKVPQVIVLNWITTSSTGQDSVACSDTLRFECKPVLYQNCLEVLETHIKCVKDSISGQLYYTLQLTVQNTSTPPYSATHVILTPITTPAPTVFPNPVSVGLLPPNGITTINTGLYWTTPPPVGSIVCFKSRLADLLSGNQWCCFENDTFCVTIPPCCCLDVEDLCADFEQAVTWLVDTTLCKVTLQFDSLLCPGYIEWINWGDGNQTYGPFYPGSMPMHTYSGSGTYVISYLAIQLDETGSICLEKLVSDTVSVVCPSACKCGNFGPFYVSWKKNLVPVVLSCGGAPVLLPCPAAGGSYTFTSSFQCVGSSCPAPVTLQWTLKRLPGTLVASGTATASPIFSISILPAWYATPGLYELQISAVCGSDTCRCRLLFRTDCPPACPCTPQIIQQLAQAVQAGFGVSVNLLSCQACFSPLALSPCDSVEWFINTPVGTPLGVTWGNQPFCYTFPGGGSYTIVMKVTRLKPDGTLCEVFLKYQIVKIKCLSAPVPLCETVFQNPGFDLDAKAGILAVDGATAGWTRAEGKPQVVQNTPGSLDGWAIRLQGNADISDAFSAIASECVKSDSGVILLRIQEEASGGGILPGTEILIAFDEASLLADTGAVLKITLPAEEGWREVEIPYDLNRLTLTNCNSLLGGRLVKPAIKICNPIPIELAQNASVLVDFFCLPARKVVSTEEDFSEHSLRLYPIPTTGLLNVVLPDDAAITGARWRLSDCLGRTLHTGLLTTPLIDISALPAGVYLLHIEGASALWVRPVVKQ